MNRPVCTCTMIEVGGGPHDRVADPACPAHRRAPLWMRVATRALGWVDRRLRKATR